MSSWREQKVLRMPAEMVGFRTDNELLAFYRSHKDTMGWDPGHFAPSFCSSENGPMLDYILSDRAPVFGDGTSMYARPLYEEEKQKYLPVFQEMFPAFTMEQMESVHYCAYTWYDGTEAPYCY